MPIVRWQERVFKDVLVLHVLVRDLGLPRVCVVIPLEEKFITPRKLSASFPARRRKLPLSLRCVCDVMPRWVCAQFSAHTHTHTHAKKRVCIWLTALMSERDSHRAASVRF